MLAAARRSLASTSSGGQGGEVSQIITRSFEYLMSVSVGTPPTHMLAIADTGSDLVWVNCGNNSDYSYPHRPLFDPTRSSSYGGAVGCQSDACKALSEPAYCDAASDSCEFRYKYADGARTEGVLATETFSFGGSGSDALLFRADKVKFGCANYSDALLFLSDGLVGLNGGALSLVTQLGEKINFGRRFSYCLVPFATTNASSALDFGATAVVSGPGAATTPLVASKSPAYYTVQLESVAVGGQAVASKSSLVLIDSGTTLTILDPALREPMAAELRRRITLPPAHSQLLDVCYNVTGRAAADYWGAIPDVTLQFGGGAAVTLRPENTFALMEEGTLCLVVVPVADAHPGSILGNVAQNNFCVGYDLDARTVTFAPADCTRSSASS